METLITNGLIIFSKTTFNPSWRRPLPFQPSFTFHTETSHLICSIVQWQVSIWSVKLIWNNLNEKDKLGGTSKLPQNILDLKVFFVTVRVKMKKTIHFVPMTLFTSVFSCVLRNCFSIMESIEIKGSMDMK